MDRSPYSLTLYSVMWVVSFDAAFGFPAAVQYIFKILYLFVGDVSFMHPGCSGISNFSELFAINVGCTFTQL